MRSSSSSGHEIEESAKKSSHFAMAVRNLYLVVTEGDHQGQFIRITNGMGETKVHEIYFSKTGKLQADASSPLQHRCSPALQLKIIQNSENSATEIILHKRTPLSVETNAGDLDTPIRLHWNENLTLTFLKPQTRSVTQRFSIRLKQIHSPEELKLLRDYETASLKAHFDNLTGAYNRHYLNESIESELTRMDEMAPDSQCYLSVIYFDIDDFKKINTEHSETGGDEVLKEFANHTMEFLDREGSGCKLVRHGGDEFVILSTYDQNQATSLIRRLRQYIMSQNFPHIDEAPRSSYGLITVDPSLFLRVDGLPQSTPELRKIIVNSANFGLAAIKKCGLFQPNTYGGARITNPDLYKQDIACRVRIQQLTLKGDQVDAIDPSLDEHLDHTLDFEDQKQTSTKRKTLGASAKLIWYSLEPIDLRDNGSTANSHLVDAHLLDPDRFSSKQLYALDESDEGSKWKTRTDHGDIHFIEAVPKQRRYDGKAEPYVDVLTQSKNEAFLNDYLDLKIREWKLMNHTAESQRKASIRENQKSPFALIYFSIDDFAKIRNNYSMMQVEHFLVQYTKCVIKNVQRFTSRSKTSTPHLVRGDDGDYILLVEGTSNDALKIAEFLRKEIEQTRFYIRGYQSSIEKKVTSTFGITDIDSVAVSRSNSHYDILQIRNQLLRTAKIGVIAAREFGIFVPQSDHIVALGVQTSDPNIYRSNLCCTVEARCKDEKMWHHLTPFARTSPQEHEESISKLTHLDSDRYDSKTIYHFAEDHHSWTCTLLRTKENGKDGKETALFPPDAYLLKLAA